MKCCILGYSTCWPRQDSNLDHLYGLTEASIEHKTSVVPSPFLTIAILCQNLLFVMYEIYLDNELSGMLMSRKRTVPPDGHVKKCINPTCETQYCSL